MAKKAARRLKKAVVPEALAGVEGLRPMPKRAPAVFMFQPTHYKIVQTRADLELWERLMVEQVGMRRSHLNVGMGGSISGSGGVSGGWDD